MIDINQIHFAERDVKDRPETVSIIGQMVLGESKRVSCPVDNRTRKMVQHAIKLDIHYKIYGDFIPLIRKLQYFSNLNGNILYQVQVNALFKELKTLLQRPEFDEKA